MHRFADLVDQHAADLGIWETKSVGMVAGTAQWLYTLVSTTFRYYAGWTDKIPGEQVSCHKL